ncbi:hypothetical protein KOW79_013218 [Hemibagrus wyckioides]|uniref:Dentin sialophosphoprotein-like n=1 Tax=Hemibagrus wyckioides TaxID=337641 RepID=A0A9D3NHC8_9TELE|nr:hypothetical protein KOW79_013218 [Hemibagrus wyckioides]
MKRVVLLLSVVLLTCAAPLHQNNELSSSQESQVTSRVTQFRGNSGSDIIIKAPAGFGKPNEKGQSTVTVSLRDENTNVSIDVVSFIFSVNSEEMSDAEVGESNGGFSDEGVQDINAGPEEKIIDNDEEMSEEGFDPTAGPEVLNGDKDLDKSEEETPDPKDNKSGEDQIHSTSSQSETRVDSEVSDQEHSNVFETTATSDTSSKQEDSNESEHQKTKSNSAEPSAQHLSGQLTSLRLVLASSFVDQETTSSEANAKGTNSKLDISSVEGQTVPTISESMLGPFQKASELSSSSEEKTDDEYKNSVADPTPSKSPSLNSHPESMAGYDNQDPYHKTESEDPRHAVEQETTAYSVEENESRPTEISNIQDNSYSEEQPQSPSISPSSTPVSLPEGSENIPSEQPSNSSSIETSREMQLLPSKGANDFNGPPDPAVSDSEEGTETGADAVGKKMAATGSFSSEESAETTDSEQDSQNPMDQPAKQGTPDPAIQTSSHMSVVQLSPDIQEAHNEEEPQSQSPVALIPAFSSEEDEPLANTIEHIMALAFSSETNEEGKNPDSTRLDNTFSKNNQNEESYSNESATDSPRISAEVTREPVHLTTESPPFDSESAPTSDSLVSNEDASSEKITPNPSTNLHITQSSGGLVEANANNAKDSEESQESQIFTSSTAFPIASQPAQEQYTENSSDEENTQDRKSNQGIISQFPVETSAKIIATNLWTSFLQALKVPIANPSRQAFQKNARRPQSTRRYHQRSNRRQKANSSEESK